MFPCLFLISPPSCLFFFYSLIFFWFFSWMFFRLLIDFDASMWLIPYFSLSSSPCLLSFLPRIFQALCLDLFLLLISASSTSLLSSSPAAFSFSFIAFSLLPTIHRSPRRSMTLFLRLFYYLLLPFFLSVWPLSSLPGHAVSILLINCFLAFIPREREKTRKLVIGENKEKFSRNGIYFLITLSHDYYTLVPAARKLNYPRWILWLFSKFVTLTLHSPSHTACNVVSFRNWFCFLLI